MSDSEPAIINVFVHPYSDGALIGSLNRVVQMVAVPALGEHIALAMDGDWYEVKAVVHCPFNADTDNGIDAEVYASKVNQLDVLVAARLSY